MVISEGGRTQFLKQFDYCVFLFAAYTSACHDNHLSPSLLSQMQGSVFFGRPASLVNTVCSVAFLLRIQHDNFIL